jgi:hypothetical protein
MLSNEEVVSISESQNIQRSMVYQIRSEFTSLSRMSQIFEGKKGTLDGISIDFFTKNCPLLVYALPEISMRVLNALGKSYFDLV